MSRRVYFTVSGGWYQHDTHDKEGKKSGYRCRTHRTNPFQDNQSIVSFINYISLLFKEILRFLQRISLRAQCKTQQFQREHCKQDFHSWE